MEEIKQYRTRHNLTQSELALQLGVSLQLISMIETGNRPVSRGVAIKLKQLDPDNFSLMRLLCPDCKAA